MDPLDTIWVELPERRDFTALRFPIASVWKPGRIMNFREFWVEGLGFIGVLDIGLRA